MKYKLKIVENSEFELKEATLTFQIDTNVGSYLASKGTDINDERSIYYYTDEIVVAFSGKSYQKILKKKRKILAEIKEELCRAKEVHNMVKFYTDDFWNKEIANLYVEIEELKNKENKETIGG